MKPLLLLLLSSWLYAQTPQNHQAYREVYLLSLEAFENANTAKEKKEAAWVLAQLYKAGKGVTKDEAKALKWHKRAAKYGSVKSQEHLISYYFSVRNDWEKGAFWAFKAAKNGSDLAMSSLGLFFEQAGDYEKAAKWYQKGADSKGANSMFYLALMYHKGVWYHKDEIKALFWFKKASSLGHKKAQTFLSKP